MDLGDVVRRTGKPLEGIPLGSLGVVVDTRRPKEPKILWFRAWRWTVPRAANIAPATDLTDEEQALVMKYNLGLER